MVDQSTIEALGLLGFDPGDLAAKLIQRLRAEVIAADGLVFSAGDASDHLFVLIDDAASASSTIEIFVERDDTERTTLIERVVGGICGEMEFVGRDESGRFPARMFSGRALTPGRLVKIPYRALLALEPRTLAVIDRRLAAITVERFRGYALATDAGLSTNRPAVLARTILQLAEDTGVKQGGGRRVPVKKTQQQLADEVGLTREVVNGHLNEWVKAGLLSFDQGGLEVRDLDRFRRLVEMQRSRSRGAHERTLQKIDGSIGNGDSFRARNLALEALRFFPESSELQHRAVLAAARCGAVEEAEGLIHRFGFGPDRSVNELRRNLLGGLRNPTRRSGASGASQGDIETDDDEDAGVVQAQIDRRLSGLVEDVLALPARLLKDRVWARGEDHADRDAASQAQLAYERAYAATNRAYVGINAASLALMAGNRKQAEKLAAEILSKPKMVDYWSLATRGEALALLDRWPESGKMFDAAMRAKDATPGGIASTRLQMRRLVPVLGSSASSLMDHLPQVGVIAISGHMMLAQQMSGPVQERAIARLAPQLKEAVAALKVGIAYGALAAGADILLAEAVLGAKGHLNAVLPFRVEDFLDVSVRNGVSSVTPAPDWRGRFATCLARAGSLTITSHERLSTIAKADLDDMFRVGNRRAMGLALLKADELVTEPVLLAIYDGSEPQSVAGTAFFVREAEAAGIRVESILCDWRSAKVNLKKQSRAAPAGLSIHRPVLFLWLALADEAGGVRKKKEDSIKQLLTEAERFVKGRLGRGTRLQRRVVRSASIGLVLGFTACEEALEAAYCLRDASMPDGFRFRVICDFGPVGRPDSKFNADRLSKLDGANDIPELPANMVVASESFAAEARYSHPARVRFDPVGRVSPSLDARARLPLPSIALYRGVLLDRGSR